jgi:tight adherence protein C
MTLWLWGALAGLIFACGTLLAAYSSPPMRPTRLHERLAPYVIQTHSHAGRTVELQQSSSLRAVTYGLVAPALRELASAVDTALGGSDSVRRRLGGLGSHTTVEQFRVEQVVWGASGGVLAALGVALLGWIGGSLDPILAIVAALVGVVGGIVARDYYLTAKLRRRESAITTELPIVADLLALAVTAGESPATALERICVLTNGELTADIATSLAAVRAGKPLTKALSELAARSTIESVTRFFEGLIVAIERGTPLAGVLRAQAADVHEMRKRALLAAGGRKEISMMVPVVFLLLPVTVVFALFPGLSALSSLTR